jgi:hypothetical protein
MGVGSFLRGAASGAGSVLDAFGDTARRRGQEDYNKLLAEVRSNQETLERKQREADDLKRRWNLEADARIVPRAAAMADITQSGLDRGAGRDKDALTHQTTEGIRAVGAAGRTKIDVSTADYRNQGDLDDRRTKNDVFKMDATARNQLGLLGGSYMDLLKMQGGLSADTQRRFIGSTPLMEQLGANERDSRRDYLNTVLELDQRNQPQGIAKFAQQLGPVVGLGASILSAFV